MIFGVCKGIADCWNLRVGWLRAIAVVILLCTGIFPIVVIYLIAAMLMKSEPLGLGASLRACPYA
jgi:phage shock protein C